MKLYLIIFFLLTNISLSQQKICYTSIPHLDTALYYFNLPTIETSKNGGKNVEYIIGKGGGNKKSRDPWCAWFVSMTTQVTEGIKTKFKTGLARNIAKNQIPVKDVLYAKVVIRSGFTVNLKNGSTIFGHTGLIYKQIKYNIWQTVEGNIGNRVNISQRTYNSRDYQRITGFTPIKYKSDEMNKFIDTVQLKPLVIKGKTSSNTR